MRETHVHSTSEQTSHQKVASKNRNQFVSENKVKATPVALKKADGQGVNTQGRYQKARPAKQQRQAARAQRKVKRAGKK
jgi:CBS-domain-containing membrane protein